MEGSLPYSSWKTWVTRLWPHFHTCQKGVHRKGREPCHQKRGRLPRRSSSTIFGRSWICPSDSPGISGSFSISRGLTGTSVSTNCASTKRRRRGSMMSSRLKLRRAIPSRPSLPSAGPLLASPTENGASPRAEAKGVAILRLLATSSKGSRGRSSTASSGLSRSIFAVAAIRSVAQSWATPAGIATSRSRFSRSTS